MNAWSTMTETSSKNIQLTLQDATQKKDYLISASLWVKRYCMKSVLYFISSKRVIL